jgi:2-(1,2-epoxy-1,2-dihydrophenyl)acetyl-CoA isomerase
MTDPQVPPRVLTAVDGDVWRITLDRPQAGNALDLAMATELAAALRDRPEATRAVLILGNGERFCVGGDVHGFAAADDPGAVVGRLAHDWHEVIRLCARSTRIRPAYAAIGLSPDGGTSWALTRALGAPRALDLMLTNGELTAAEAHLFGLVGRLVEDEDVHESAIALAHQVAAGPVRAMVRTRALVRKAATRTLDEQLDEEARLITESAADPEGREGVRAFLEKRTPDFRSAR